MNNVNIATYDVFNSEMWLDSVAGKTGQPPEKIPADRTLYPISCAQVQTLFRVKEDKGFYIPDFLTDTRYDDRPEAHSAAMEHAQHLHKGECLLDEALNLVKLMLASFGEECDSRAMQTETALRVIEKKLNKAHTCIDRHDTRHTNLFLAYADLKGKADGGEAN